MTASIGHGHARAFPVRALLVGMVHGLAGSAALVLLSLGTLTTPAAGFAFIAIFGFGSILGMALLSAVIAVPLHLSSRRLGTAYHGLSAAVGLATVALGCHTVFRIASGGA